MKNIYFLTLLIALSISSGLSAMEGALVNALSKGISDIDDLIFEEKIAEAVDKLSKLESETDKLYKSYSQPSLRHLINAQLVNGVSNGKIKLAAIAMQERKLAAKSIDQQGFEKAKRNLLFEAGFYLGRAQAALHILGDSKIMEALVQMGGKK